MSQKEGPHLIAVIWEGVPDPDYEEHLRRVFEILFAEFRRPFDENSLRIQDEPAANGRADLAR